MRTRAMFAAALLASAFASPERAYPQALLGRYAPRTDLPSWLHTPRWCTRDAPRYREGGTAKMISDFADRGADTVRLGTYWGGLAMFPSEVSPRVPALKPGVDPLAEAMATVRARRMHLMAYVNPNAYRKQNPSYGTNSSARPAPAYGGHTLRMPAPLNPPVVPFGCGRWIGVLRRLPGVLAGSRHCDIATNLTNNPLPPLTLPAILTPTERSL